MPTWVLIITLLANSRPVSITSVPGYKSLDACSAAGREAKGQYSLADSITFVCVPGPEK
jgi:hypothetical protein